MMFLDTWNTPRIAQAFVKMAESGRAKVKEVIKYTYFSCAKIIMCFRGFIIYVLHCVSKNTSHL